MKRLSFKKGQKTCIFCGYPANSGEHVWPKWLHPMLPRMKGHTQLILEGPVTKNIMSRTHQRHRQGSVAKVAIHRVCKGCNGGWMSAFEQRAKPTLKAMIIGPRLALGTDSQRLLVEYFTLKLMVLDWTNADPVFTQDERTAFWKSRTIPGGLQMTMARCPDPTMFSYYRTHFMEGSDTPRLSEHAPGKNIKTFGVGFGGIFLFALAVRDGDVDLALAPLSGWTQIHPHVLPMVYWPPNFSIDKHFADRVASSLDTIKGHAKVRLADDIADAIRREEIRPLRQQ